MNLFKASRLILIAFAVTYLLSMVITNVARTLRYEIGVSITSMEDEDFNLHPLYTFCPRWIRKELEETKKPEDFINSTNLDDAVGGDGFWTTKLKFISEGRFVPCYTYEKPKPVALGTYDAVAKFVIDMDQVTDLTLGVHDSHGYIDSYYSMRGNNRLAFPSQILGAKVSREMRFEIATILVIQLVSDSCIKNADLRNEYCLEKNIADGLQCLLPGSIIEGEEYKEFKNCSAKNPGLVSMMPDPSLVSQTEIDQHLEKLFCLKTCDIVEYYPELTYDKTTETEDGEPSRLSLFLELKNKNREKHEEYYVYEWTSFFADFGGHVGLLLGYSLLTFYDQLKGLILKLLSKKTETK